MFTFNGHLESTTLKFSTLNRIQKVLKSFRILGQENFFLMHIECRKSELSNPPLICWSLLQVPPSFARFWINFYNKAIKISFFLAEISLHLVYSMRRSVNLIWKRKKVLTKIFNFFVVLLFEKNIFKNLNTFFLNFFETLA